MTDFVDGDDCHQEHSVEPSEHPCEAGECDRGPDQLLAEVRRRFSLSSFQLGLLLDHVRGHAHANWCSDPRCKSQMCKFTLDMNCSGAAVAIVEPIEKLVVLAQPNGQ